MAKRSFWAWGMEKDEPTLQQRREKAATLSTQYGIAVEATPVPKSADLNLRKPRISAPPSMSAYCSTDTHERAVHSYGRSFTDRIKAFSLQFPNPPDVVAFPRNEHEVERVMHWCWGEGYAVIPYGGGSSTVGGIEPPGDFDGVVTIDLRALNQVLEIDELSRSALIQAGVYGPALEDQLRPHGFTLRHFPQSFEFSTLGGWIATRSGGHYATNHTHIDDFVESTRMVTPGSRAGSLEVGRDPVPTALFWAAKAPLALSPRPGCASRCGPSSGLPPEWPFPRSKREPKEPARLCNPSCGRPIAGCWTQGKQQPPPAWTALMPCW